MIKTIADVHPEKLYVMPVQYKYIKYAKANKAFVIKNEEIAQQLIVLNLIKKETKRNRFYTDTVEKDFRDIESGKYLLTPDGAIYLDYKKHSNKANRHNEFRAWITLIVAVLALCLSVLSIYIQYLDYVRK